MTIPSQWEFTAPYEGIVPHMYLDSRDNVTAGVGFLIRGEIDAENLFGKNHSSQNIRADFDQVRKSEPGRLSPYYAALTNCRLEKSDMKLEFHRRMGLVQNELRALFPSFDSFPEAAQVALRDMGYNLGTTALRNKWPHLRAAIPSHNWKACALECLRDGVPPARNLATHALFLEAAHEQT